MGRGGRRRGAGRPAGSTTKKTRELANEVVSRSRTRTEIIEDEARAAGLTPLEWMLSVVRDPQAAEARRDEMAKSAAPFVHPRLNAVSVTNSYGGGESSGDINITQVFSLPRGSKIENNGTITIEGEPVTELASTTPYAGTAPLSLTDQSEPPIVERLPVHDVDTTNVTPMRRRDESPD
jgi:hypothetical protein